MTINESASILRNITPRSVSPPPWLPLKMSNHPLAKSVVACFIPGSMNRYVDIAKSGIILTPSSGAKILPSYSGGGIHNDAATTHASSTINTSIQLQNITIAAVFIQDTAVISGAGNNVNIFGVNLSTTSSPFDRYALFSDTTLSKYCLYGSFGSTFYSVSTGVTPQLKAKVNFVATITSGSQAVWLDGVRKNTGSNSGTITYTSNDVIEFGYSAAPTRYSGANTNMGVIWSRVLTDIEIQQFSDDPYCIVEPDLDIFAGILSNLNNYTFTLENGTFNLTGNAMSILASRLLVMDSGTFNLTGNAASLLVSRILSMGSGSFALTGNDINLLVGRKLVLESAAFNLTGNDINIITSRILRLDTGVFNLTGNAITLSYSGAVASIFGYYALEVALKNLIQSNVSAVSKIFIEGQDQDIENLSNMPLLNIRIADSMPELIGISNKYYESVVISIDVSAFDFTSYRDASSIVSNIIASVRRVIIDNKQFYTFLDTTSIEPGIRFEALSDGRSNGHVAKATMTILCGAYIN